MSFPPCPRCGAELSLANTPTHGRAEVLARVEDFMRLPWTIKNAADYTRFVGNFIAATYRVRCLIRNCNFQGEPAFSPRNALFPPVASAAA